jgi:hypothetical protein
MKQRLFAVLGVLALAACGSDSTPTGSDLCAKATTVGTALTTKLAACIPDAGGSIVSGSNCTTKLASCTAADQAILNSVLDCLNTSAGGAALTSAQCTSATFTDLATALDTCTNSSHIGGLSAACSSAMGFGT